MATTLAEIRAKLQQQENNKGGGGDNAIYPHWNMKEGEQAVVRFLPDSNPDNPFFWQERLMINLEFNGIKGDPSSKKVFVKVPCVEMFKMDCPVLKEVRTWFQSNDKEMENMGRKYWKKRSYIFQGFVRDNPLQDDESDSPIRRFIMGPQIFEIIKASLMDPELEDLPIDYENGLNFHIKKTSKGQYADYSTSSWSRKTSPLTEEELTAIDEHGLHTLSDFLPKQPGEEEIRAIAEMFEASVNGEPYDPNLWSEFYRPPGLQASGGNSASNAKPAPQPAKQEAKEEPKEEAKEEVAEEKPAETEAKAEEPAAGSDSQKKADDILAKLRARKNA